VVNYVHGIYTYAELHSDECLRNQREAERERDFEFRAEGDGYTELINRLPLLTCRFFEAARRGNARVNAPIVGLMLDRAWLLTDKRIVSSVL
jgi:hypothetical protein